MWDKWCCVGLCVILLVCVELCRGFVWDMWCCVGLGGILLGCVELCVRYVVLCGVRWDCVEM